MKIAYIGFSKTGIAPHTGATPAGIALSDFTYSIISEQLRADYINCQDLLPNSKSDPGNLTFYLRTHPILNCIDAIKFLIYFKFLKNYNKTIVYHSLLFAPFLVILKLFGGNYILQVNEIFHLSGTHSSRIHKIVEQLIFRLASGYIISTELIINELPLTKRPLDNKKIICVIPGPIAIPNVRKVDLKAERINLRLVYAGIIDKKKNGGAFIAIELAHLLDDSRFSIDVYGFGTVEDIALFKYESNNTRCKTKVTFLGNLAPTELKQRLGEYDIGLATQYIGTSFSSTSFPSKILTYLGSGLHVMAATSPALEAWRYKSLISLYSDTKLSDLVLSVKEFNRRDNCDIVGGISCLREQLINDISRNLQ
jgi:hypothetical protein